MVLGSHGAAVLRGLGVLGASCGRDASNFGSAMEPE